MGAHRQMGLDAVRGIAILLVLLFHFNQPVGIVPVDAALMPMRVAGWAGVELFFVLSGFLVGGLILSESAAPAGFDPRRFLMRRAYRLWPVLFLYVLAMALGGVGWTGLWPVLLHVQNYAELSRSHLWSLAVEEHFYLLAALALPWLVSACPPRRLIGVLTGLIVAVNLLRLLAVLCGVPWEHVHWHTQYRIDALAAGVLLAAVLQHHPHLFVAAQRHRTLLVLTAASGFAVLALRIDSLLRWSIELTIAWMAAVPLIVAASGVDLRGGLRRPARAFAALGRISYPLYIWHLSVGNVAAILAERTGMGDPLLLALVRFGSTIGVAAMLHHSVELPFLRLRERIARSAMAPEKTSAIAH